METCWKYRHLHFFNPLLAGTAISEGDYMKLGGAKGNLIKRKVSFIPSSPLFLVLCCFKLLLNLVDRSPSLICSIFRLCMRFIVMYSFLLIYVLSPSPPLRLITSLASAPLCTWGRRTACTRPVLAKTATRRWWTSRTACSAARSATKSFQTSNTVSCCLWVLHCFPAPS